MARKKEKKEIKKPVVPQNDKAGVFQIMARYPVWIISIVTTIAYLPILWNGFIFFDDPIYQNIRIATTKDFIGMFTTFFDGNYDPLTRISLSIDFGLWHANATGFHITSLVLHLLSAYFLFRISVRVLGDQWRPICILVTLAWSVHPMHVESVAWVAERKDQLYGMFYLGSLFFWIEYREQKIKRYLLTTIFFIGSLLSKGQAVTLPLVLIAFEIFLGRLKRKNIFENVVIICFIGLAVLFSQIAIKAQQTMNFIKYHEIGKLTWFNRITLGCNQFLIYLSKMWLPVHSSLHYFWPQKSAQGEYSAWVYASILIVIVLFALGLWMAFRKRHEKKYRVFLLAMTIFIIAWLPVSKVLIPVGISFVNERYTYIAYIGFSFFIGSMAISALQKKGGKGLIIVAALGLYVSLLGAATFERAFAWSDPMIDYRDMIASDPAIYLGYEELGKRFFAESRDPAISEAQKKIFQDSASLYLRKAIELNPEMAVTSRSELSLILSDDGSSHHEEAIESATLAMKYATTHEDSIVALRNRANAFYKSNMKTEALRDLTTLFKEGDTPRNSYIYYIYNISGLVYIEKMMNDSAFTMFDRACPFDLDGQAHARRSYLRILKRDTIGAINDWDTAQKLHYPKDTAYSQFMEGLRRVKQKTISPF